MRKSTFLVRPFGVSNRCIRSAGILLLVLIASTTSNSQSKASGLTQTDVDESLLRKYWPKLGILQLKMKDGSTKTVDLSQVDSIAIQNETDRAPDANGIAQLKLGTYRAKATETNANSRFAFPDEQMIR